MLFDDGLTNVQPQAEFDPAATLDLDPLRPVVAFPDAFLFLWWQPWPRIAHPDSRLLLPSLESNRDGAIRWRIFQGVGEASWSRPARGAGHRS
jgi:hypothetical protein